MKLPSFRRIVKSDYDEENESLIETLSFTLNASMESLFSAFNRSISLKDNVACTVKNITVAVDSSGKPKSSTQFRLDTNARALGITVLNAINNSNPSILPLAGVFVSFSQEGTNIIINNIKGLPSDQQFTLTLVAFDT